MKILVTGGCGFIGSNFIRHILKKYPEYVIVNIDALTYAGNTENLRDIKGSKRYRFVHGRIEDTSLVADMLGNVDYIVNFAAETHVDRSIHNPHPFLATNILGTHALLEAVRSILRTRTVPIKKFVHISTDEVYGALGSKGKFTEKTMLAPNSPYSASKASADLLIRAYYETYKLPVVIIRPSNNYGYYQFPEKFIPLMITNLLLNKSIPVYGKGENVRDWCFVEDTCAAIDSVMHNGKAGEIYNAGGNCEVKNIELAKSILKIMGKSDTRLATESEKYIKFVKDRPGHDYRYALDNSKIKRKLKWSPTGKIEKGLEMTIKWYKDNEWWWKPLKERLSAESRGFWER
ncbi:MAG: dTDP-glucose 4,6-dehydratase [Thermodesulfovibrionales bacterium]|nr:dTDP-glucose 4,6-dehydratase [Thermodesulfovibrionales bacterium]